MQLLLDLDSMSEILILSTTDTTELAQSIAYALIEANEAACVNIVPGIRSIYQWEGKVCDEGALGQIGRCRYLPSSRDSQDLGRGHWQR